MTEIGRLLLLPPPTNAGRSTPVRTGGGTDSANDPRLSAPIEEAADATSHARGKQFRFRVMDGGRNDFMAGNAEVPARTDPNADNVHSQGAGGAASGNARNGSANSGRVAPGTPLSTFLAQLIAQEQLPQGLYDPPVKAADRAYRQAGGEPALDDDAAATAHFRIAV